MNNHLFTISLLCLLGLACTKSKGRTIPEDSGCIELKTVQPGDHSGYSINSSNIPVINALFDKNGIDRSHYRYRYFFEDSTQTSFPPFVVNDTKAVRVSSFANGLEIFPDEMGFVFINDTFHTRSGNETRGTTLGTTPTLRVGQVRTLFIESMQRYDSYYGSTYKDSCFSAQFGYFNTNAGTGNGTEHLIKAWKVTPKNTIYPSEYPIAYYQDDGTLISYSNGIVTFK